MLRARANGETIVSATMCPRLPGPLVCELVQPAKKVVSGSLGLVEFAVGLVDLGKRSFFGNVGKG